MPKYISLWVKNVNKLFIGSWLSGVLLSPFYKKGIHMVLFLYGKVRFILINIPNKLTLFYTIDSLYFNPLNMIYNQNPQGLLLNQLNKI
jgi:hypothetical protein